MPAGAWGGGNGGEGGEWPEYLDERVERVPGDVEDPSAVREALEGCDGVAHLAAMVGVGQSMYQIERYTRVNDVGTAVLLEALIERPVERLLVASSMSIYGEGLYRCHTPTLSESGGGASEASGAEHLVHHASRSVAQLQKRQWEPRDSDGQPLHPIPTPESKQPELASIYALNKYVQERSCLITGRAYGISTVAMRFFNVYGPHQALSNPYTGVLAIFASRLLNGKPPLIFEDGLQRRDFVSVRDIARGCRLALEAGRCRVGACRAGVQPRQRRAGDDSGAGEAIRGGDGIRGDRAAGDGGVSLSAIYAIVSRMLRWRGGCWGMSRG